MANHKSSEKRARQAPKRQARNASTVSNVKTIEKKLLKAIDDKSKDVAETLKQYTSKVMSAVSKGAIKKQTASRKIGRLATRVAALTK